MKLLEVDFKAVAIADRYMRMHVLACLKAYATAVLFLFLTLTAKKEILHSQSIEHTPSQLVFHVVPTVVN